MKMRNCILVIIIFGLLPLHQLFAQSRKKVAKANEMYKTEQYDDALNIFRDAALENPDSPYLHYNIGNTLYKQGKFEEAFPEFEKVLSAKDADLHFRSYYNMGNTLYRMKKLPEAIQSYTKALELNPDDYDSKHNLEYVRQQLKKQEQEQQDQQNQDNQDKNQDQEQKDNQNQDQENKDGKQEQQEQQEQDQQKQDENKEDQQEQQQQQQGEQKEMTREEAEKILNALKNDEKDLQKQRKMKSNAKVKVLKDW